MSPSLLRQLWSLIEGTQANQLLQLDDGTLLQWLMGQLQTKGHLNSTEQMTVNSYIQTKMTLIREMAEERLVASA
jgi:succinate dehydrogenase flavin-adding protein (antitoxin of CptAB toxin-antitoxin module)